MFLAQALLRVKYFVTQLKVRKEFANRSAMDVEAAIEDLAAQEKTLRANKVLYTRNAFYPMERRIYFMYQSMPATLTRGPTRRQ